MKVVANIQDSLGGDLYRLTLYGNGTSDEAITAGFISNGYYVNEEQGKAKRLAQGSVYINTKTLDVVMWDEENKKFGA